MHSTSVQSLTEPTAVPATPSRSPFQRKGRWLLLAFLLPMLAWNVLGCEPAVPPQPPFQPTGQIVFECKDSHLCLVNADGSSYTQITFGEDRRPAWSPDGKRIVFERKGLAIMEMDSKRVTQLINDPAASSPYWSPDGSRIVFMRYFIDNNPYAGGIYIINVDGTGRIRLTTSTAFESDPVWSPDGKQIAFVSDRDGVSEIYVMNADGSNQRQLTSAYSRLPSWSPDGTKITYSCSGVCVVNSDGSGLTELNDQGGWSTASTWSPDGQYIAYQASCFLDLCGDQLWIMKADGSQQTKLTDGFADHPAWRPVP